ncbi:hypothetical protein HanPSC8_Chr07g0282171 [Helianthus annuus]|nr:hypothetical protein HanPSC8_Chr07g0282171 [Helianthus annuus]
MNEERGLCLCSFILVKRTESLVCVCSFTKRTNTNELPGRTVHEPFAESSVRLQPYIQSLKYVCMPKSVKNSYLTHKIIYNICMRAKKWLRVNRTHIKK